MAGFFGNHELSDSKIKRSKRCGGCRLNRGCTTRNMPPYGDGEEQVMIVGGSPGAQDDRVGIPFCGPCGQYIKMLINGLKYDLDRDCIRTNAVTCMTPDCRQPSDVEIDGCRPILEKLILKEKPHVIIAMGQTALQGVLGDRLSIGTIGKWRGFHIPDRKYNAWVCPVFHPNYVMREIDWGDVDHSRKKSNGYGSAAEIVYRADLKHALAHVNKPLPALPTEADGVYIVRSRKRAIKLLNSVLRDRPYFTFDYETTGLKPEAPGHEIVCVGFCTDPDEAYVIELTDPMVVDLWKRIMEDPHIPKIAQNLKFEDRWTRVILDTTPQGWFHDTQTATHIEDNRSGITGLKFQAVLRYGLIGYDTHVSQFLKTDDGGSNSINRIREADLDEVMTYCGIDALVEHRLFLDQCAELGIKL